MITTFFKPKSKLVGCKRSLHAPDDIIDRPSSGEGNHHHHHVIDSGVKKKQLTTTAATTTHSGGKHNELQQPSSTLLRMGAPNNNCKPLSEEATALLSFLHNNMHERDDSTTVSSNDSNRGTTEEVVSWRKALIPHFATSNFTSLAKFVANERASKTVYPPPHLVFSAMNLTPLHKVKVVIVGQDPYHQPNQGHGLSFSVPHGIMIPPSLRNIYKELHNDADVHTFTSIPQHGNLERWAKQGVLLLNNVLTVRKGEAASHAKKGWEEFTDKVIAAVIERDANDDKGDDDKNNREQGSGVVFLLWGKPASLKAQTVLAKYNNNKRAKHAVIMCSHPSPLGATKTDSPFIGSKCFSRANEELVKRGWNAIDWRVDGPLS